MQVTDTTGAGDAFMAGYLLAALASSLDRDACLRLGAWVSGQKIQGRGAQLALPTGNLLDRSLGLTINSVKDTLRLLVSSFSPDA